MTLEERERHQRVSRALGELLKPTYVYRMAVSQLGARGTPRTIGATKRLNSATLEIDNILKKYNT